VAKTSSSMHPPLSIQHFDQLCQQPISAEDYPLAESINKNIVCYSGDALRQAEHNPSLRLQLLQELYRVLQHGSGVLFIRQAYPDTAVLEYQNKIFRDILEREAGHATGDHFAKAGANGRIWNALQKSALINPGSFIEYYKNPLLSLVAEAWLGPDYQMTAQVNVIYPGGRAQAPHRDYHLGFQSDAVLQHYPPHVHEMSAHLTLQGAIAHTDMPLESGPTLFLPFSQQYPQGYLAWRDPEFKAYFEQHAVQLPLVQGDAVFFNPALFHAAGSNQTQDFDRIGNLLQMSSAFGRAMEVVDHYQLLETIYPALLSNYHGMSDSDQQAILSNACEGYSFPTCLDTDPPLKGVAPETQKQLTERALQENWPADRFVQALNEHRQRRTYK